MPMRTAFSLACVSMTISLLSFSISFTLFRRQWQRSFTEYKTVAEFLAIKGLAHEVLAQLDTELTSSIPPPNPLYPDISHVYTSAT